MAATRIQVCGPVTVEIDGRRVERELPGRQGKLLFVYLVVNRSRRTSRDELVDALWPDGRDGGLSPLLSKLRRVAPVDGRSDLALVLPQDTRVDLEAAAEALHRAESAVARAAWREAWGPARVPQHVALRGFLAGEDAPWIDEVRRRLDEMYARALEIVGRASLEIRGTETDTAERAARALVDHAPFRESGYRLLMEVLAARENRAEALLVYDELRRRLRDELGTAPSQATQELHRRLLE